VCVSLCLSVYLSLYLYPRLRLHVSLSTEEYNNKISHDRDTHHLQWLTVVLNILYTYIMLSQVRHRQRDTAPKRINHRDGRTVCQLKGHCRRVKKRQNLHLTRYRERGHDDDDDYDDNDVIIYYTNDARELSRPPTPRGDMIYTNVGRRVFSPLPRTIG